jgi:hypothetical protein
MSDQNHKHFYIYGRCQCGQVQPNYNAQSELSATPCSAWVTAIWRESFRCEHTSLLVFCSWLTAMGKLQASGWPVHFEGREQ